MNKYRTLIVSDTHLGSDEAKPEELFNFLKENTCDVLILNGDIIDVKYLTSINSPLNFDFIYNIIDEVYKNKTKVIYLTGNHDNNAEDHIKLNIFTQHNWYRHTDFNGKSFCVSHGDKFIFDNFVTNSPYLEGLTSKIITFLNHLQKVHSGIIFKKNKTLKKGLEYYTLADDSRSFIKKGLKIISLYKKKIKVACKFVRVDGVICGHIHLPEIKNIGKYTYMNSGDFVENFSALVETRDGEWKIIRK